MQHPAIIDGSEHIRTPETALALPEAPERDLADTIAERLLAEWHIGLSTGFTMARWDGATRAEIADVIRQVLPTGLNAA